MKLIHLTCIVALVSQVTHAQTIYSQYDSLRGAENNGLLIGEYQEIVIESAKSNPFYKTDKWTTSDLKYKGRVYQDVPLLYNILEDYLITEHPQQLNGRSTPVKLFQTQVEWFMIKDQKFVYLDFPVFTYDPGYYQELFVGQSIQIYVKRTKELGTNDLDKAVVYLPRDTHILRVEGVNYRIKSKSAFTKAFKTHKTQIKEFIKANSLWIKPENESDIIQLANFCNTLLGTK